MKYVSTHMSPPHPTIHPTELLLAMAVEGPVPEENDHFLHYLSLAFAVIVTKQVITSFELPDTDLM
jgi:hypothetical protein